MPTTILNEGSTVDGHALDLLPEMVARYVEPFTIQGARHDAGETPVQSR